MGLVRFLRFLVALFFDPKSAKGILGEFRTTAALRRSLDNSVYRQIDNVTLLMDDGTTQIDHVIVSPYGVFVIETKNMTGWIFGSERQATWTQVLGRQKNTFQNPLRQNYRHVWALSEVLGIPKEALISIVIFAGSAEFKTEMPSNIVKIRGAVRLIKSYTTPIFTESEIVGFLATLEQSRMKEGCQTDREHLASLRKRHGSDREVEKVGMARAQSGGAEIEKANEELANPDLVICPICGAPMVMRNARRGDRAGKNFWGCSRFPKCRGTRSEDK